MIHINEWDEVLWDTQRPQFDAAAPPPPRPAARTALVDVISGRLAGQRKPPMAVHFYLGEGLRWIRVGFDEGQPLPPEQVRTTGRLIAGCLEAPEQLYFHALRPHDLLFFLEGGKKKSKGMEAGLFGQPLEHVLQAWGLEPPPTPARPEGLAVRAAPRRRIRSAPG